jgi:NAD(P)H dehydrogenase (quinone)
MGEGDAIALIESKGGEIYEIAGDTSFSMAELAAEAAKASGKPVAYVDLAPADYSKALQGVGLPGFIADMLADSSFQSSKGALFDDSGNLSRLLGRPTTPIAVTVANSL